MKSILTQKTENSNSIWSERAEILKKVISQTSAGRLTDGNEFFVREKLGGISKEELGFVCMNLE